MQQAFKFSCGRASQHCMCFMVCQWEPAEAEPKLFLGRFSLLLPLCGIVACRGRKIQLAAPRQHQEPSPAWNRHVLPHLQSWKWQMWGTTEYRRISFCTSGKSIWSCPGRIWWFKKSAVKHWAPFLFFGPLTFLFLVVYTCCFSHRTHKKEKRG